MPKVPAALFAECVNGVRDRNAAFEVEHVEGVTAWLRHAVAESWIDAQEVIDAVAARYPNRAVWRVVNAAEINAAKMLNKIVAGIAGDDDEVESDFLLFRFLPSTSYHDAYCSVATTRVVGFCLHTVDRLPFVLARLVNDTLEAMSMALLAFATPCELWGGRALGWYEEIIDEVRRALRAGALRDTEAAIAALNGMHGFCHLYGNPVDLVRELNRYLPLVAEPPRWIGKRARHVPTKRLRARAHACCVESTNHPWALFVLRACDVMDQYAPKTVLQSEVHQLDEGEVPLSYGLAAFSGSKSEHYVLGDLHDQMMQTGDVAVENYPLRDIAVGELGKQLAPIAAALGLLMLANHTNQKLAARRVG